MANQIEEYKSKIALAIEQRQRKLYPFEVQGFFGLGDKVIQRVAIRVAVKAEEDEALVAAHVRIKALASEDKEAMGDNDLKVDQKLIQILHRICFSPDEETKDGVPYPAFPGPEWMRKNLTTDQIACLMNLYHEVRYIDGPMKATITTEDVCNRAIGLAKVSDTEIPEALLANTDRTWLTHAFILLSVQYKELLDAHSKCGRVSSEEADEGSDAEAGAGGD